MSDNCFYVLIGNKTDLIDSIEVSRRQGELFAEENDCFAFYETSAKEGTGIKELFDNVALEAYRRRMLTRTSNAIRPNDHLKRMKSTKDKDGNEKRCCTIF